jgi:hypothetical protein
MYKHSAPELEEECGGNDLIENCRREHSAEHHNRQRIQNFLARLPGTEEQWQETDEAGQGGHHHRSKSLQAASNNHLLVEQLALVLHQVDVMGDHHNPIATDDSDQGDEPHPMRDR